MRLTAYARVSSDVQAERGIIENQGDMLAFTSSIQ